MSQSSSKVDIKFYSDGSLVGLLFIRMCGTILQDCLLKITLHSGYHGIMYRAKAEAVILVGNPAARLLRLIHKSSVLILDNI